MSECYVKQVSFKKFLESIGVSSELDSPSTWGAFFDTCQLGPSTLVLKTSSAARPVCTGIRFPLPELTARVDGCQKCAWVYGPSTWPMNSGRELGYWKPGFSQKWMTPKCSNLAQEMTLKCPWSDMVLGLKGQRSRLRYNNMSWVWTLRVHSSLVIF